MAPQRRSGKQRGQATNRSSLNRRRAHMKPKARPPTATPCVEASSHRKALLGSTASGVSLTDKISMRTTTHPLKEAQIGKGIVFPKGTTCQSLDKKISIPRPPLGKSNVLFYVVLGIEPPSHIPNPLKFLKCRFRIIDSNNYVISIVSRHLTKCLHIHTISDSHNNPACGVLLFPFDR